MTGWQQFYENIQSFLRRSSKVLTRDGANESRGGFDSDSKNNYCVINSFLSANYFCSFLNFTNVVHSSCKKKLGEGPKAASSTSSSPSN